MAIENLNLSNYTKFNDGDHLYAPQFNAMVSAIQTKVNEIIANLGSGSGSPTPSADGFYVNGVKTNPVGGIVRLASKARYVLSGMLNGTILVGQEGEFFGDADQPVQLVLDNLTVVSDSTDNAAIDYLPSEGKMLVTIKKNTINHLVCTHETPRADSQKGALNCGNDLFVQGSGYLSCVNRGGHGIKASELHLNGNPHIYSEAVHDGIHGNKFIGITGGIFYVNGANDAFGTRAESGTPGSVDYKSPGKIFIFGGEFFAYNIAQAVFDSKGEGFIFAQSQVMNIKEGVPNTQATGIVLHTDRPEASQYVGVKNVDPTSYFGVPSVSGATLSEDGTTYTATTALVTISGYFSGKKFVFPIKSTEVTLANAYIEVADANALEYTYDGKNIKIKVNKDSVSVIKVSGEDAACIKSINNIAFEPKNNGYLVLQSDAASVTGSEITFRDGFGAIVSNKEISGSQINMGEPIADAFNPGFFGGVVIAPVITARLSGKGQKGNFTVISDTMLGVTCCDMLRSAGLATLADSEQINYHRLSGSTFMGDTGRTIEPYDVVPYGQLPIPSI